MLSTMNSMNEITFFGEPEQWHGKGRFTPEMQNFSNLNSWINMTTLEFQNVISQYNQAVKNDGIIDIMEKKHIVKEIDEFFNCLVALRFFLCKGQFSFSVSNSSYGFSYTFNKEANGWNGKGTFTKKYKLHMEKFKSWYENIMLKKFSHFCSVYKKSVEDGIIDDDERNDLYGILDYFIFELLLVRNFIHKGHWKK